MPDMKAAGKLPFCVRILLRHKTRRQTTLFTIVFGILAVVSIIDATIASGSESTLARILFYESLPAGCIFFGVALWGWLALRWVDHKGQWVKAPN